MIANVLQLLGVIAVLLIVLGLIVGGVLGSLTTYPATQVKNDKE